MEHIDIIVYALIAVVLLARLWAVFGRRNEEDRQRRNPFTAPAPAVRDDENVMVLKDRGRADDAAKPGFVPISVAPMSLAGGLEQIKKLDPSFDEKQFLQNIRAIFSMIVGDFAKDDLSRITRFLGPAVLPRFQAAVAARMKAGEKLDNRILRIKDAETLGRARVEDTRAIIAVRIVSEQENVLRDVAGNVVSGTPDTVEEIIDLWTFGREAQAAKDDWQLIETRS